MNTLVRRRRTLVEVMLLGWGFPALCFAADAFAQVAPPPLISAAVFPPGDATAGTPRRGVDLIRYSLGGPDVLCNDGTTPVMYLRRSTNQVDNDKWLIYLEGGGNCNEAADCHDRWISGGVQPNYGLQKMSTSIPQADWDAVHPSPPDGWTLQAGFYRVPAGIRGGGILSPLPANPFAGWNIVYANYCSSDDWSGQRTDKVLQNGAEKYRIHFRGATIFDALIAQLQTGATVYQHAGHEFLMPDLDAAGTVLLSGSSGGGHGVKHNLDLLRSQFPPSVKVRGVIDAAGPPTQEFLPWNRPPPADTYFNYMTNKRNLDTTVWNHRGDATCLALNPAEPWRCADATHVLRHHITTPFFVRTDLQDKLYIDMFLTHYVPATYRYEFAVHTSVQLHEIASLLGVLAPRYPPEAATMAGDPNWLPPGVYGPRCTDHVGLIGDKTFLQETVPGDTNGLVTSLAEALHTWVNIVPGAGTPSPELVTASGVDSISAPQCP